MTTQQPTALRLAELMLERPHDALDFLPAKAAAELRRLHDVNQALLEALKEVAALKRPDPCRKESNAGRWVTWTVRTELVKRVDDAIAKAGETK